MFIIIIIIIIIIVIIIGIIVLGMRHYKLSHGVYDQEMWSVTGNFKDRSGTGIKRPGFETEHLRPYNAEDKNT